MALHVRWRWYDLKISIDHLHISTPHTHTHTHTINIASSLSHRLDCRTDKICIMSTLLFLFFNLWISGYLAAFYIINSYFFYTTPMDINNNNLDKPLFLYLFFLKYRPQTQYLTGVMVLKPTHYPSRRRIRKMTDIKICMKNWRRNAVWRFLLLKSHLLCLWCQ